MKKLIAGIAIALLALTGCSPQQQEASATSQSSSSAPSSPAPAATKPASPELSVVTYKVAAMYTDQSAAPVNVAWNSPSRKFDDVSGSWEISSSTFKSGDYAQILVTPSDSGVKAQCAVYVNGEQMAFDEVEESSGRAECKYMLP